MSGASSSLSNISNGGATGRRRSGRFVGIPKKCWYGESMVSLMSNSEHNPHRRYFRCAYAAAQKLVNDNHIFKWIDEALLNEVETLQMKNAKVAQELKDIATEYGAFEKLVFEKVQMRLEKEIFERVEDVLVEAKYEMKKMMVLMVLGCMIVFGILSFVV